MDPNALLLEIHKLVEQLHASACLVSEQEQDAARGIELAEKFSDLSTWIMRGGYLPRDWDLVGRVPRPS